MPKRRSQISMSEAEQADFLENGRTLQLATIGVDGFPHLSVMWYAIIDGKIFFNSYGTSQKCRNIERDARVTCMVESGGTEYEKLKGLALQGRVEVVEDSSQLQVFGTEMAKRYPVADLLVGAGTSEGENETAMSFAPKRKLYVMCPEKIYSWDHTKLPSGVH